MALSKYVTKYVAVDVKEYAALQAKCERYEKALKDISNPIAYLQRKAEAEGAGLDGHYAQQLANSASFLQKIADEALSAGEAEKQKCQECATLKAKGEKLAQLARSLARSVVVHPDYGKGKPNEFFDLVDGVCTALAEWKGEKEPEQKPISAGHHWKGYISQFEKLNEFWNNLPEATALWLAQQIDIFAKLYPAPNPQGAVWVKTTDRLPGWNQPVYWRIGVGPQTKGKTPLSEMFKGGYIENWQWQDESAGEKGVNHG
jgi:hypothetical protein